MQMLLCPVLHDRKGFPGAVKVLDNIVTNMAALPGGAEVDINNVTLRLALDITGRRAWPLPLQTVRT